MAMNTNIGFAIVEHYVLMAVVDGACVFYKELSMLLSRVLMAIVSVY